MLRRTTGLLCEPFRDNEDDESNDAEDDLITHYGNHGFGCPIADHDVEH